MVVAVELQKKFHLITSRREIWYKRLIGQVMELLANVSNAFWNENFWLPPNYTWKDIEPGSHGINHANYKHLIWPLPISFAILCLRYIAERFWFEPLGKYLGVKAVRGKAPPFNAVLENAYRKKSKFDNETMIKLSKQLDMNVRKVERWWRKRRMQDNPTTMKKFCEHCWRCLAYSVNFSIGLAALWDKPYFWDVLKCADNYPHQAVDDGVWWYYMISMAFVWSLAFSQFVDTKRKDFWEMFIHHAVCLLLLNFSWVVNIHRVSSIVLIVHDAADIFLDAAKSLNYAKMKKSYDIFFVVFTLTWIVTRLYIFPRIIYGGLFQIDQQFYPAYVLLNILLCSLLVLHIIWTFMILKVIQRSLKSGQVEGDVRSSSDEFELEESHDSVVDKELIQSDFSGKSYRERFSAANEGNEKKLFYVAG